MSYCFPVTEGGDIEVALWMFFSASGNKGYTWGHPASYGFY